MTSWRLGGATPAVRWIVGTIGVVVVFNALLAMLERAIGGPQGPTSSSYATSPGGSAALAELLARHGRSVEQLRTSLTRADLDPRTTVVALDPPPFIPDEAERLEEFVREGGVLVLAGPLQGGWLNRFFDEPPRWRPGGPEVWQSLAAVPETASVRSVQALGDGSWDAAGDALPVLGTSEETTMVVASVGDGRVSLLADSSPLQNRFLARGDNAALGLALSAGRPVVFVESIHGYGDAQGLSALPTSWRIALAGLTAAALVYLWSRARRLGPPERASRELAPPRRAFVDSLAATLARTKHPGEAAEPVVEEARRVLSQRAGLRPNADEKAMRAAANRLGLGTRETDVLVSGVLDERDVVAAGTALAQLRGGKVDRGAA